MRAKEKKERGGRWPWEQRSFFDQSWAGRKQVEKRSPWVVGAGGEIGGERNWGKRSEWGGRGKWGVRSREAKGVVGGQNSRAKRGGEQPTLRGGEVIERGRDSGPTSKILLINT